MSTANHILKKFNIKTDVIEIPNTGRDDLAFVISELGFKTGVEVGVASGENSRTIMRLNPQMTLYGVDPYVPYQGYKDYQRQSTFNQLKETAHKDLDGYPNYHFIEEFSVDAAKQFEDESLDFVYLDGNHRYPDVKEDIATWWPKVKKDGILAGHDYARIQAKGGENSDNWGVIPAVQEFVKQYDLQLYVWGLEAKIPHLKRDGSRSWMVIK